MRFVARLSCVATVSGLLFTASSAQADPPICEVLDPITGECLIEIVVPGDPGGPIVGGGGGNESGEECVDDRWLAPPGEVPCSTSEGYWSNQRDCYISLADPQPPKNHPLWLGHTDGAIWWCGKVPNPGYWFWSESPPDGPDAPPVPGELAQEAVAAMQLHAIEIGIVPEPGPDSIGLIGLPTWMWAAQPTDNTWGPATETASAGGVTVTATARVTHVDWDMGDGSSVICTSPGTPYADSYGRSDSPDCGHRYTRTSLREPDNAYAVSATSYWEIQCTGGGQSSTIELDLVNTTQVRVGEMQVVVTR